MQRDLNTISILFGVFRSLIYFSVLSFRSESTYPTHNTHERAEAIPREVASYRLRGGNRPVKPYTNLLYIEEKEDKANDANSLALLPEQREDDAYTYIYNLSD